MLRARWTILVVSAPVAVLGLLLTAPTLPLAPTPVDATLADRPGPPGTAARPERLPSPARGPPEFRFEPATVDLGRLPAGRERTVRVGWRRTGSGTLRPLALDTGCACAVASGLPERLPPRNRGAITVVVHAPKRAGPFEVHVRAFLVDLDPDRGRTHAARVTLRGRVTDEGAPALR
jgi:hypothetical protein